MRRGLSLLAEPDVKTSQMLPKHISKALLVLTDGEPNMEPPRGYIEEFKNYLSKGKVTFPVYLFGFGYRLNSQLLVKYGELGHGSYSFIPDGSLLGTTFIHYMARILTNAALNLRLTIASKEPIADSVAITNFGGVVEKNTVTYDLGALHESQERSMLIPWSRSGDQASLSFALSGSIPSVGPFEVSQDVTLDLHSVSTKEIEMQAVKNDFVRLVTHAFTSKPGANATACLDSVLEIIKNSPYSTEPLVQGVHDDLQGQVREAFAQDAFTRWGQHYLPSLLNAHVTQFCNNFKDKGVQGYALGDQFLAVRSKMEDIFADLPAPKPSVRKPAASSYSSSSASGASAPAPAPAVNMRAFYNRGGGCFTGDSMVATVTESGASSLAPARDVKPGDKVLGPNGVASIVYVVKSVTPQGEIDLVTVNDSLKITSYHPVRVNNQWTFPCHIQEAAKTTCPVVYDFVLDKYHSVYIGGVECVSLGHEFNDSPVVAHEFFGSSRVVADLRRLDNGSGIIELLPEHVKRNSENRIVAFSN